MVSRTFIAGLPSSASIAPTTPAQDLQSPALELPSATPQPEPSPAYAAPRESPPSTARALPLSFDLPSSNVDYHICGRGATAWPLTLATSLRTLPTNPFR